MKVGKLSESDQKRFLIKPCKFKNEWILTRMGIGMEGALWEEKPRVLSGMTSTTVTGVRKKAGRIVVHRFVNRLACLGLEPFSAWVTLLLPSDYTEEDVKATMEEIALVSKEFCLELSGCYCEVIESLRDPILTMAGNGRQTRNEDLQANKVVSTANIKPEQDVIVSGYIGMEGVFIKSLEHEQELSLRFNRIFMEHVQGLGDQFSVAPAAHIAMDYGVTAMYTVETGGIFGALWEMVQESKVGLSIDVRKIPVMQEVIEVCEQFEMNPYQIPSAGCLLMIAQHGEELSKRCNEAGIPTQVIGRTKKGNDRLLWNEGEKRFLEPPSITSF